MFVLFVAHFMPKTIHFVHAFQPKECEKKALENKKKNIMEKLKRTRDWGLKSVLVFLFFGHYDMFAMKMDECLLLTFIIYLLTFQLKRNAGFGETVNVFFLTC